MIIIVEVLMRGVYSEREKIEWVGFKLRLLRNHLGFQIVLPEP